MTQQPTQQPRYDRYGQQPRDDQQSQQPRYDEQSRRDQSEQPPQSVGMSQQPGSSQAEPMGQSFQTGTGRDGSRMDVQPSAGTQSQMQGQPQPQMPDRRGGSQMSEQGMQPQGF